jgi:ribosomal protein S27E
MKDELDAELCKKYPKIFQKRNAPPSQSCMHWGIAVGDGWYNIIDQLCASIQWRIDRSLEELERHRQYLKMRDAALAGDWTLFNERYSDMPEPESEKTRVWIEARRQELLGDVPEWMLPKGVIPQVIAEQVKEKFGTLRFYYTGGDEYISGQVAFAETMSGVTCEECGAPGVTGGKGWVSTLCETHREEHMIENKER